jgi:hypothetical protein
MRMHVFIVTLILGWFSSVQAISETKTRPVDWEKVENAEQARQLIEGRVLNNEKGWQFRFHPDGTYDYRPSPTMAWSNKRKYSISGGIVKGSPNRYTLYTKSGRLVGYWHSGSGKYISWM